MTMLNNRLFVSLFMTFNAMTSIFSLTGAPLFICLSSSKNSGNVTFWSSCGL